MRTRFLSFNPVVMMIFAQARQVIAIGMPHFLGQAVQAQAFEKTRDLPAGFLPRMSAQAFVLESTQVELTSGQGLDQALIGGGEEVQSGIRPFVFPHRFAHLLQAVDPGARIVQGGEEFQVAPVAACKASRKAGRL